MTKQISFNEHEKALMPEYRAKIASAESTADVRKFFERTAGRLLEMALDEDLDLRAEDVRFAPEDKGGYVLGERLLAMDRLREAMGQSDLKAILRRLAEPAVNRHAHLEKHPDKTESKMYPRQDGRR